MHFSVLGIGRLDGPFIFQKSSTYNQKDRIAYSLISMARRLLSDIAFPFSLAVYFPFADFPGGPLCSTIVLYCSRLDIACCQKQTNKHLDYSILFYRSPFHSDIVGR